MVQSIFAAFMDSTDDKNVTEEENKDAKKQSEDANEGTLPPEDLSQENKLNESQEKLNPNQTNVEDTQTGHDEGTVERGETDKDASNSKVVESTSMHSLSRGIPKRYVLLFLVFLGFVNIYGLRINLNVALVAMVNNRSYTKNGVTVKEPAEFHWNSKTQG